MLRDRSPENGEGTATSCAPSPVRSDYHCYSRRPEFDSTPTCSPLRTMERGGLCDLPRPLLWLVRWIDPGAPTSKRNRHPIQHRLEPTCAR